MPAPTHVLFLQHTLEQVLLCNKYIPRASAVDISRKYAFCEYTIQIMPQ